MEIPYGQMPHKPRQTMPIAEPTPDVNVAS